MEEVRESLSPAYEFLGPIAQIRLEFQQVAEQHHLVALEE